LKETLNLSKVGQNDSTELAIHIRKIHFTSLIICIAIFVSIYSSSTSDIEKAIDQLQEIEEVVQRWKPTWLRDYAKQIVLKNNLLDRVYENSFTIKTEKGYFYIWDEGQQKIISLFENYNSQDDSLLFKNRTEVIKIEVDSQGWIVEISKNSSYQLTPNRNILDENWVPKNLSDFKLLWNCLQEDQSIVLFKKPIGIVYLHYYTKNRKFSLVSSGKYAKWQLAENEQPEDTVRCSLAPKKVKFDSLSFKRVEDKFPEFKLDQYNFTLMQNNIPGALEIPIEVDRFLFNAQSGILHEMILQTHHKGALRKSSYNWKTGNFEYSFRPLDKITNSYQDLQFSKIEQILESERKRSSEYFDFFGTKVPLSIIFPWGILILIATQIYFNLHLDALVKRFSVKDKALSTAWMLFYPGLYPFVIFITSAIIFPLTTGIMLIVRSYYIYSANLLIFAVFLLALPILIMNTLSLWRSTRSIRKIVLEANEIKI
jgi:hypothetical protein